MVQRGIRELSYLALLPLPPPALNPIYLLPLHTSWYWASFLMPRPSSKHGGPCSPSPPPFEAEVLPLFWKSCAEMPLFGTQADLTPGPELVRGLWLLLSRAANKDLRTSLFVGKKASSEQIMSSLAAQMHVPGRPPSQSCL